MTYAVTEPRRLRAAWLAVVLPFLVAAPTASAAPQTFPDPSGSGASVTISDTDLIPGQRIQISGTGFTAGTGGGFPLIAIKPYDIDPVWESGGTDWYPGPDDARIWFVAKQAGGGWSGSIDVPPTLTTAGLAAGPAAGTHWLRILSGQFSTGDAVTPPITYKVPFTVADPITLGLSTFVPPGVPATPAFQAGSTFRPGASITVRAQQLEPSAPVAVELDGAVIPSTLTTEADGSLPATARLTLPAGTPPGAHTLRFTTGALSGTESITVTPLPTASLPTSAVRPGGRFAFAFRDFVGVGGAGQKVAVVVNEAVLACVTADASGNGSGTAVLTEAATGSSVVSGTATVGFASGTSCTGPTGPQNDLPGTRVTAVLGVSAAAPAVSAAPSAAAGSALAVTGSGFAAGAGITAALDGAPLAGELGVTGAGGEVAVAIALPAGTAAGEHTLLVTAGGRSAVTLFTATEAVAASTATPGPVPAPTPVPIAAPAAAPAAPLAKTLRFTSGKLRLTLTGKAAPKTTVTVKTASKVRLGRTRKLRTLAKATTSKVGTVTLKLTGDGRRVLKRGARVKVIVEVKAAGRAVTTRRLTLRVAG